MRLESEVEEVLVCAIYEIVRVLTLVHPSESALDHVVLDCLCGNGEVVVGDLGEEEVMGDVSICVKKSLCRG